MLLRLSMSGTAGYQLRQGKIGVDIVRKLLPHKHRADLECELS